jgi:hypothetical protein
VAEIALRGRRVRGRPDNRGIAVLVTLAAGLLAIAMIFATNGLGGPDSRSQGGSGGGAPRYVSFVAPQRA